MVDEAFKVDDRADGAHISFGLVPLHRSHPRAGSGPGGVSADGTGWEQPQAALLDQALNGLTIHGSVFFGLIQLGSSVARMAGDWDAEDVPGSDLP